ncbi:peptide-N4-asparagine amidase, partial [Streptomyces xanthochromogenes]|uniref:peptide-N4-asparagine amidase n=1 Tax=Streptomyces xanthochromogenes TaxID=67384 RepID=UPI003D9F33FF
MPRSQRSWNTRRPDLSIECGAGPPRRMRIKVDGQLAGIAAPFPTVWTGGWSN